MPLAEHDINPLFISITTTSSFNSRAPRGARPIHGSQDASAFIVSIHVPLAEHDFIICSPFWYRRVSIHVPLAEHDQRRPFSNPCNTVSIHVPLAEHDQPVGEPRRLPRVSIHVPLAEHDPGTLLTPANHDCFNSRAPRGARQGHAAVFALRIGFNSRAPRGARRADARVLADSRGFNSRAPRGARPLLRANPRTVAEFQFTCPSRSTTCVGAVFKLAFVVSIHVPLAEHDFQQDQGS